MKKNGTRTEINPITARQSEATSRWSSSSSSWAPIPTFAIPPTNPRPSAGAYHGQQQHVVDYMFKFATSFDALRCDGVERVAVVAVGSVFGEYH
jgi:hypothetical protein